MCKFILTFFSLTILLCHVEALEYKAVPDWLKLPEGRTQVGNMHGDVAVSSKGEVYVSVMNPKHDDPMGGLQVYSPDGKYLRNVPNAPDDFHGFVIHKEKDGEFIYGTRLNGQSIMKMTLDGKVLLNIPASVIPDEFKIKEKKKAAPAPAAGAPSETAPPAAAPAPPKSIVRFTAMDVAPNGDLYVTDGYASDYVHRFDKTGKYIASFGGKKPPYNFSTLHKIAIDTRFTPPRIIACDRANGRVVHMSLEGELLGVVATDLMMPAAVAIYGDYAAIAEIKGRMTILDKAGKVVTQFGANTAADEVGTNKTPPEKWRPGIVTAPHGVAFNAHGDVFASEFNVYGRVHRFNRQ